MATMTATLNKVDPMIGEYYSHDFWFVTAISPVSETRRGGTSPLFPILAEDKPIRRILQYTEIRDNLGAFTDVVFYGIDFDPDKGEPKITEVNSPVFEVKNQTLYLDGEIMCHPRHMIGYYTPSVGRWTVRQFGRTWYVVLTDQMETTVTMDEDGNRNSLFELSIGDYQNFAISSNIELKSAGWAYTLPLLSLIRVSDQKHVAISIEEEDDQKLMKPFILEEPLTMGKFEIEVKSDHAGKRRAHIVRTDKTPVLSART